jgi:hypothetical protein
MPFDVASTETLVRFNAPAAIGADQAELDAAWAVANPERALAFLMVAPQPCAALDALLDLPAAA